MKGTAELVARAATFFYNQSKVDPNGRYHSWEHCYKCFHDARNNSNQNLDYTSLQLAFYLASWGMYRGSSFLLQKDYKVHIPVVEKILDNRYDCLFGIEYPELRKAEVQELLKDVEKFMVDYYEDIRIQVKGTKLKNKLSNTLITKILMGSFGCVPAYDRFFVDGIKEHSVTTGNYNNKSLMKLVDFYDSNRECLESARRAFKVYNLQYPQMKLLDMGFWQIGFEKSKKEKTYSL